MQVQCAGLIETQALFPKDVKINSLPLFSWPLAALSLCITFVIFLTIPIPVSQTEGIFVELILF